MTDCQKDSTTLHICPKARHCAAAADCEHAKPHAIKDNCPNEECGRTGRTADAVCVPASGERDCKWSALRGELVDLQEKGVRSIDPVLVLRFMDYIEQAAEAAQ
jgi:hypothetical protein